ncbi:MAG TPA: PilN domain-containing protein [Tepidisphaeraceae bacterium]|jgi:hypothetical protein
MIGRSATFVGLAVGERSIACAEVSVSGPRGEKRSVRRTATFLLPTDLSLDRPDAVGQALAIFLRQHRFGSTRAVVGIPARWLVAIEKELPPADEESAQSSLRLQAERLAVSESGELVFDYAGESSPSAASRVLLVGTQRQRLENIERAMDAAGMHVAAVTSTGLALAACVKDVDSDSAIVLLNRAGAEMIWREKGVPRILRHVTLAMNGHGKAPIGPLAAELRRAMAMSAGGATKSGELLLLNGIGLPQADVQPLAERIGMRLNPDRGMDVLGVNGTSEISDGSDGALDMLGQYGGAVSLAISAAQPSLLPLDFRHSRLAPPRARKLDRLVVLGSILGLAILVGIIALYVSVQQRQRELDQINSDLTSQKSRIDEARGMVDRVTYSQGFFEVRPKLLECLRQITLSFRDDERVWISSFNVRDNGKGTIAGKASDRKVVLALLDRLKKNQRFSEFKLLESRDADNRSSEVTFSMSFTFTFAE